MLDLKNIYIPEQFTKTVTKTHFWISVLSPNKTTKRYVTIWHQKDWCSDGTKRIFPSFLFGAKNRPKMEILNKGACQRWSCVLEHPSPTKWKKNCEEIYGWPWTKIFLAQDIFWGVGCQKVLQTSQNNKKWLKKKHFAEKVSLMKKKIDPCLKDAKQGKLRFPLTPVPSGSSRVNGRRNLIISAVNFGDLDFYPPPPCWGRPQSDLEMPYLRTGETVRYLNSSVQRGQKAASGRKPV